MFTEISRSIPLALLLMSVSAPADTLPTPSNVLSHYASSVLTAPLDKALTLARTGQGDILLVLSADKEGVTAISLQPHLPEPFSDALEAYHSLGPAKLLEIAQSGSKVQADWSSLTTPVNDRATAIAAGTNYAAHADEVSHEDGPFLFPKLVKMSAWNSPVYEGARLDYEVELCALPLADYTGQGKVEFGYMLCGDFSDRWTLVRDIKLSGDMGKTGFPTGKGGESHFPTGPFLLIPRNETFYREINLSLYVNGELRQNAPVTQMIWKPLEILDNALADCKSEYVYRDERITLTPCNRIAAGTPILTGTPEGVVFRISNLWSPWAYLSVGDEVVSFGTYLGFTKNVIREREE